MNANELILECRVRGEPKPIISWTKDNVIVDPAGGGNERFQQIDQADGTCKFVISNPDEHDSGVYVCKAENSVYSDKISHNVVFGGQNAHINEKTHGFYHLDTHKPHIQNTLGDHFVTAGGTLALQAEIVHSPSEVQWLREKDVIKPSDKVQVVYERGIHTLILTETKPDDAGTYTCRAANKFGKVESIAHVYIVGPKVIGGKCALFLSRPEPEMKIQIGDPFSISFRVQGEPKPKCKRIIHFLCFLRLTVCFSLFSRSLYLYLSFKQ